MWYSHVQKEAIRCFCGLLSIPVWRCYAMQAMRWTFARSSNLVRVVHSQAVAQAVRCKGDMLLSLAT